MIAAHCLNCETEFGGDFCPACGQRADTARITLRRLLSPVLELASWERGLVQTSVALVTRPGKSINDYLAGKRVRYVPPIKFVAIVISAVLVLLWLLGPVDAAGRDTRQVELLHRMARMIEQYGNVLFLSTVPFIAAATRILFRARGLNFAEHLVVNAYVFGIQNLVSLPILPLQRYSPATETWLGIVYFVFYVGYFAVVLRQVMARRWWTAGLAAVAISVAVYLAYFLALAALIRFLG